MGTSAELRTERVGGDVLVLRLSGDWTVGASLPVAEEVLARSGGTTRLVRFETGELGGWDSALLAFLVRLQGACREGGADLEVAGLPEGVARLVRLASRVPREEGADDVREPGSLAGRVGAATLSRLEVALDFVTLIGDTALALGRLVTGRARLRAADLWRLVQDCGASAVGVISLISLLIGLILALVGSVQLRMFGAEIYVADLVGIAMAREMGAMMVGILMAGRTGAAFAARLGTMTVNGEIDALHAFGVSPIDFLVLPRVLALVLMMPVLCVYADFMGIAGGALVGVGMLDLGLEAYLRETIAAVRISDVLQGLFKSVVYGVIVALTGCLYGMRSGRSASSVGLAATSAVVTSIIAIIVADAALVLVIDTLGL